MRWEYKTVRLKAKGFIKYKIDEAQLDTMMNELGRDGWELVSALGSNFQGNIREVTAIFKRSV